MRGVDTVAPLTALNARTNALGADFSKVWYHGELSGVDGVKAAIRGDTDLKSTMQFALRIVNVRFTPCNDCTAFDGGLRDFFGIDCAERRHNFRNSAERFLQQP
jgi:hypothetical protein